MLITKESQEALIHNYIKRGYSTDQNIGFIDGVHETMELIERIYKESEINKSKYKTNENLHSNLSDNS
jgi:hypothetical protein